MNKILSSLLAISFCIIILSSCQSSTTAGLKTDSDSVKASFSAKANIKTNETHLSALVSAYSNGDIVITLVSPNTLKGVKYTLSDTKTVIENDGLRCIADRDYLPSYNPCKVIYDTVSDVKNNSTDKLKNSEYNGKTKAGDYTVLISDDGYIKSITSDYSDTAVNFTDIKPLNDTKNPTAK